MFTTTKTRRRKKSFRTTRSSITTVRRFGCLFVLLSFLVVTGMPVPGDDDGNAEGEGGRAEVRLKEAFSSFFL